MKVLIDTNIIISAALFPNGKAASALTKALTLPFEPILCDYVIEEVHRKFREKWPHRVTELEAFLFQAVQNIETVQTPDIVEESEEKIRDVKDRPILRSALNEHANLLLTGDRDFLESSITDPRIISVSDFLAIQAEEEPAQGDEP